MDDRRLVERDVIIRIVDANANRCAEGLRVVEETARFYMSDPRLAREIKELRHEVRRAAARLIGNALRERDSSGDVGASFSTESESSRPSLMSVPRANFRRAEESLRVLEEYGKVVSPSAALSFKELRFRVYSLEKNFLAVIGGSKGIPSGPFLYLFVDRTYVGKGEAGKVAASLIQGGTDVIQYRAKGIATDEMRRDIGSVLEAVVGSGVPVIVNDIPELVMSTGAAGVHIGRDDMEPERARDVIGPQRILGLTIHSIEELEKAPLDVVDYVAAGPVFSTVTKPGLKGAGTEFVSGIRERTALPLVAIGGIEASNAESVLDAGADGLAVISSVLKGDIVKNCFTLRGIIDKKIGVSKERF